MSFKLITLQNPNKKQLKKRLQPNTTHYIGEYNKIQCITKHTTVNYKGIIGAPTTSLKSSSPDGSGKSSNKG